MATVTDAPVDVHPLACCESSRIGAGTRIWAFAHVMDGASIGADCNIGGHVFVERGAHIGNGVIVKNNVLIWQGVTIRDAAFIGPGVVFTNDRRPRSRRLPAAAARYAHADNWLEPTLVERGASLGAACVILCGTTIGQSAMVAAGAVVTRDVPRHALVVGHPARRRGWVCDCGARLTDALECTDCTRRFTLSDDGVTPMDRPHE